MNRQFFLCFPLGIAIAAAAQAPTEATNSVREVGRVSRVIPGPGDRPQGLLLRDGTFVSVSPSLAQRLPASVQKNATIRVVGSEFTHGGSRSIDAQTITLAGVSYSDIPNGLPPGPEARRPGANEVPPPPPPARGRPAPPAAPCGVPSAAQQPPPVNDSPNPGHGVTRTAPPPPPGEPSPANPAPGNVGPENR